MTINDLLKDDAFCTLFGSHDLTEKGKEYFNDILDVSCDYNEKTAECALLFDFENDKDIQRKYEKCKQLFSWMAGYVSEETWNILFI